MDRTYAHFFNVGFLLICALGFLIFSYFILSLDKLSIAMTSSTINVTLEAKVYSLGSDFHIQLAIACFYLDDLQDFTPLVFRIRPTIFLPVFSFLMNIITNEFSKSFLTSHFLLLPQMWGTHHSKYIPLK